MLCKSTNFPILALMALRRTMIRTATIGNSWSTRSSCNITSQVIHVSAQTMNTHMTVEPSSMTAATTPLSAKTHNMKIRLTSTRKGARIHSNIKTRWKSRKTSYNMIVYKCKSRTPYPRYRIQTHPLKRVALKVKSNQIILKQHLLTRGKHQETKLTNRSRTTVPKHSLRVIKRTKWCQL
jgi:hypothetical protein